MTDELIQAFENVIEAKCELKDALQEHDGTWYLVETQHQNLEDAKKEFEACFKKAVTDLIIEAITKK